MTTRTPEDRPVGRRTLMTGLAWAAPTAVMSLAAPAMAASSDCEAPSGSYGSAPLVKTQATNTNPIREDANSATPEYTQIYVDNRIRRDTGSYIQYTRTIPISLTAGCCYTFSSSMSITTAIPHSQYNGGIVGLIYFEGSSRSGIASRGQTYADWPGLTQVRVNPDPSVPATVEFSFEFCATETRVHNYYQYVRVPPSGGSTTPEGNGHNDDLRFHELTITTA